MKNFTDVPSVPSDHLVASTDQLRFGGGCLPRPIQRRPATTPNPTCLVWCAEHALDPLAVRRPHLELYIRWKQEVRRFKPSTVSRRFCEVAGFYRTCVIDGLLEHSPAEHIRRPSVPPESPTLGLPPAVRGPAHRSTAIMLRRARRRHNATVPTGERPPILRSQPSTDEARVAAAPGGFDPACLQPEPHRCRLTVRRRTGSVCQWSRGLSPARRGSGASIQLQQLAELCSSCGSL